MSRRSCLLLSLCVFLILASSLAARAASITFNLAGSDPIQQAASYSFTNGAVSLSIIGQRSQPTVSSGAWITGNVNQDSKGIGVAGGSDDVNNSPSNGTRERLLLSFTPAVNVDSIVLTGFTNSQEDLTVGALTGVLDPSDGFNIQLFPNSGTTGQFQNILLSPSIAAGTMFVGAYAPSAGTSDIQTGFRLDSVTVNFSSVLSPIAVPAPAAAWGGVILLLLLSLCQLRRLGIKSR